MIKRYNMEVREVGSSDYEVDPVQAAGGEWVTFEDHQAALREAYRQNERVVGSVVTLGDKRVAS